MTGQPSGWISLVDRHSAVCRNQRKDDVEPIQGSRGSLWKRIVDRDDLLHLAVQANEAADIPESENEVDPWKAAVDSHLRDADVADQWAVRGQAYQYAASILLLGSEVEKRFPGAGVVGGDPNKLLADARREFRGPGLIRDLTAELVADCDGIRSLRLSGDYQEALDRAAERSPEEFAGTGLETHRGPFEYEFTAACLEGRAAKRARGYLRESDAYWAEHDRAQHWGSARGRHELALGLLDIHDGHLHDALAHLSKSRTYLSASTDDRIMESAERLLTALSVAECLTAMLLDRSRSDEVLAACTDAFDQFEQIRGRWGIVARSRSPLAVVLRMVLGDIACVVARIPGTTAGRLGLRITLAAKQSGYAELIRKDRILLDGSIGQLLEEVVLLEQSDQSETAVDEEELSRLHADLQIASSPLLADLVLPSPIAVEPLIEATRHRTTLDFVQLPCSDGSETWFRTTINGPDTITFEQITMGSGYSMLFEDTGWGSRHAGGILDRLHDPRAGTSEAWSKAADEFLPAWLLTRLREATRGNPMELLISPHMQLCRIPWNALIIENAPRTRLVERAVVAQIPMLSTLMPEPPEPVSGPGLVWLTKGLESTAQQAWNLPADILVAECGIPAGDVVHNTPTPGTFEQHLSSSSWGLVHVACHGAGDGLGQQIEVPTALTAAKAFGLKWPVNVLLAACHVGRYSDSGEGEVLGFVVAAMAGGARCVVAGLHFVSARGTGEIAKGLVAQLDGNTRLDHALRDAQLASIEDSAMTDDLFSWALLAAFVR